MQKNILVVVAHPDDEVLGCGGAISRLANEGSSISIVILGEGIVSRYSKPTKVSKKKLEDLKKASRKSARVLGAKNIFLFDFSDNKFDTVSLINIVKVIEKLIKKLKPEVIFTHNSSDLNIDHKVVNRAVLTATRPVKGMSVKEIYAFEVPSSTEWTFNQIKPIFSPNVFYDISKTLDNKIKALKVYKSEIREFPHPRSEKAIIAIAQRWGSVAGVEAAEAFELLRKII